MTTNVQKLEETCRLTAIELFSSLVAWPTRSPPRLLFNQLLSVVYRAVVSKIGAVTGRCVQPVTGPQLLVPDDANKAVATKLGHLWSPDRVDRLQLRDPGPLRHFEAPQAPNWHRLTGQDLARAHEMLLQHEPAFVDGNLYLHHRDGALRRTQGSYYTPQELVEQLLTTTLDPVVEQTLKAAESTPDAQARALLGLRICDPACGGGALVLAAARRLAGHIIRVVGSNQGYPEVLGQVIEQCLYGVDLDPLAISIVQASSWLETGRAVPTHHLVVGNALLGAPHTPVLPPTLGMLPNDDRKLVAKLKLRWRQAAPIKKIVCTSKQLADLWCAGFAWPHNSQTPKLTPSRWVTLQSNPSEDPEGAEVLARIQGRQHAVHWHLRFPEILAPENPTRGFDVVLGNPPWERIKFQEKEFIATHRPNSAVAPTASQRREQLSALTNLDPTFRHNLDQARRDCAALIAHIRRSGRFPATCVGDLNAYTSFIELGWRLLRPTGRLGMIVPSGILTESTTKNLRESLLNVGGLVSAYEFENHSGMFPAVDRRMRFCLLTLVSKGTQQLPATFVFRARRVKDIKDPQRIVTLEVDEIRRQSPQMLQIPVFESQEDASLARRLHEQLPNNPSCPATSWGLRLTRVFDMSRDAHLFCTHKQLGARGGRLKGNHIVDPTGEIWVPVLEGKMVDMLDHRAADIQLQQKNRHRPQQPKPVPESEKKDPDRQAQSYLWCPLAVVRKRSPTWNRNWIGVAKRVTSVTNARTLRVAVIPWGDIALSYTLYAITCAQDHQQHASGLIACMCSLVTDYLVRQKTTQTSLTVGVMKQVPMLPPHIWECACPWNPTQTMAAWARPLLAELVFTGEATRGFAEDLGFHQEKPFVWDTHRHADLAANLDAGLMAFQGLSSPEVSHILEAFPGLHRRDRRQFGHALTFERVREMHAQRIQ